jgi:integrase
MPVGEIGTDDVLRCLDPLWTSKPETATRLRGRIEAILDYAAARGWRARPNPARWRGHLSNLLPRRSKAAPVVHHAALPWQDVPAFMARLRKQGGTAARALELCILTATRTGETIGARWSEVDLAAGISTVPAATALTHCFLRLRCGRWTGTGSTSIHGWPRRGSGRYRPNTGAAAGPRRPVFKTPTPIAYPWSHARLSASRCRLR